MLIEIWTNSILLAQESTDEGNDIPIGLNSISSQNITFIYSW
jgi:small-conductance mechanosensitive channel